ncbi:MAG: divalent-cation tolerance protein CutA [Gammaproteobacteria bacterium]|nr:divalent-cation tolerance protein CutA [Gammaproteobacteria bacterium]
MDAKYDIVLNTCPDEVVAESLASALVEKKLAACVNILPGITSVYSWQGKIEKDKEVLLVIKTRRECYESVETLIREQHPYELPEIVSVSIDTALPEYLSWINENVAIK